MKRQIIDLEKTFVNHISDKGLLTRIYEELSKIPQQKANKENSGNG